MKPKKQSGGWLLLILAILFIIGAAFLVITNAENIFGTEVSNINKLLAEGSLESNVDSYIEMDIDAVVENYAETTHKTNGITTGKDQHYIIWLDDDSMISVSVNNKKQIAELNRVLDETWDYLEDKTQALTENKVHLKGKIVKLGTELKKYYQQCLDEVGITDADRDIYFLTVDCTDSRLFLIIATAVLLVLAIIMLIAFTATRKAITKAKIAADYAINQNASFPTEFSTVSAENPVEEEKSAVENLAEFYEDPKN